MSAWDQLQAEAERDYGEAWLPHKNADHPRTLVGRVIGYDQGPVSVYTGEKPWIATIEDRHGKAWCVWLNAAVLVSEFERKRPMPDEQVAIAYKGVAEKASQPGMAPPHLYRVIVKRDQGLPPSFAAGALEPGEEIRRDLEKTGGSDLPDDGAEGFAYGQQRSPGTVITDAEVVDDTDGKSEQQDGKKDDDEIPF